MLMRRGTSAAETKHTEEDLFVCLFSMIRVVSMASL